MPLVGHFPDKTPAVSPSLGATSPLCQDLMEPAIVKSKRASMFSHVLSVRLTAIERAADNINVYEVVAVDGENLPAFKAGAHVSISLSAAITRSYSLINPQDGGACYRFAVSLDPASRGGSLLIHSAWKVGDVVSIAPPRNNFRLIPSSGAPVFIAGGIGITPMLGMIGDMHRNMRPWTLHYAARSPAVAAFLPEIDAYQASGGGRAKVYYDDANGKPSLDLKSVVSAIPAGSHIYCCGPAPMLDAFQAITAEIPGQFVHVEYFAAPEPVKPEGEFKVVLARSGQTFTVNPGQSILDAVLELGINIESECREGICGSCEVRVLEGIPDHRDMVLTPDQRQSNAMMMICCSGSKTEQLVLDI